MTVFDKKKDKKENDYSNFVGNYSLNGNNSTTNSGNNSGNNYNNPFGKKTVSQILSSKISSTPENNLSQKVTTNNNAGNILSQYKNFGQTNVNAGQTSNKTSPVSFLAKYNLLGQKTATSTPKTETPSAFQQYLNSIQTIANKQKENNALGLENSEKYYNKLYDTTNQSLLGQITEGNQNLENYKAAQQARVAKAEAALPGQEELVNTGYGEAQKVRAQTRGESEARLKNQFAGMNASDSYGAGSLTSELSGLENTFNAESAGAEVKRLGDIFGLRQNLQDVKDEADSLVATEETNLNSTIRAINSQVGLNNIEKENLIQQAYQTAQGKVDEIDNYIAQLQYQNTGTSTTGSNEAQDTVNLIDEVLGAENLAGVTGISIANKIPGTTSYTLQQKINQIKDKLALAARGQLKGQGAVSDYESKMLQNAATALNTGMNEADFKTELNKIKGILQRNNNLATDTLTTDQLSYILSQI